MVQAAFRKNSLIVHDRISIDTLFFAYQPVILNSYLTYVSMTTTAFSPCRPVIEKIKSRNITLETIPTGKNAGDI